MASGFQEAANQLGLRNATIQLLRDGLYRQCEAYMNGLIDPIYYEQIANKYVNATVTLLAIEEMTPSTAKSGEIKAEKGSVVNADTKISVAVPPSPADPGDGGNETGNGDEDDNGNEGDQSGDGNGGDDDDGGGGDNPSQESTASASAGPPVVGVNLRATKFRLSPT